MNWNRSIDEKILIFYICIEKRKQFKLDIVGSDLSWHFIELIIMKKKKIILNLKRKDEAKSTRWEDEEVEKDKMTRKQENNASIRIQNKIHVINK